jgi:transglutaminase/protease-like cytokinesis protein 3
MKIKRIMLFMVVVLIFLILIPNRDAEAKVKVNSKSVTTKSFDDFWTQFYILVGKGYNEITVNITGEDAQKVKDEIDDEKGWPFFTDSFYAKKYIDKASWKAKYLLRFFEYKVFYQFDPKTEADINENVYYEDKINFKNGYYDISNLSKKMYSEWCGQYYLNFDYSYLWDDEFYYENEGIYMWNEKTKTLGITLELTGKGVSDDYTYDHDNMLKTFAKVKNLVKSWKLENMTDYERINKINKYICDKVSYNLNAEHNPGNGSNALIFGEGICSGYSELMDIFLKTMGYESVIIAAESKDYDYDRDGHAWNVVKIDKQWYAIDTTWNDASKDKTKYLLVSQSEMKDHNAKAWTVTNKNEYVLSKKRLSKNCKSKLKFAL